MVCPFKKNITTITKYNKEDGTRTETKTVTFGECESYNCPHYRGAQECRLGRGKE